MRRPRAADVCSRCTPEAQVSHAGRGDPLVLELLYYLDASDGVEVGDDDLGTLCEEVLCDAAADSCS